VSAPLQLQEAACWAAGRELSRHCSCCSLPESERITTFLPDQYLKSSLTELVYSLLLDVESLTVTGMAMLSEF
jgi:hypothetical protein